eukprot:TRINITY_DN12817_c0_g1_i1.p2 TRINITY_DN12817_c0_g1~~TRINITY_DN12817_c0_g1_i1.p2  ORF type:complete len:181 (+),score=9.01 TRINITY_DN12817_c0_g1_i1:574-1116(+)
MGFRRLRNVRGDGNCYYRAIMYGYFEVLLTGDNKLIDDFIKMLKEDEQYFDCGRQNKGEKKATIRAIEHLAEVKKQLGILKALNEYFLHSIVSDQINYVHFLPNIVHSLHAQERHVPAHNRRQIPYFKLAKFCGRRSFCVRYEHRKDNEHRRQTLLSLLCPVHTENFHPRNCTGRQACIC